MKFACLLVLIAIVFLKIGTEAPKGGNNNVQRSKKEYPPGKSQTQKRTSGKCRSSTAVPGSTTKPATAKKIAFLEVGSATPICEEKDKEAKCAFAKLVSSLEYCTTDRNKECKCWFEWEDIRDKLQLVVNVTKYACRGNSFEIKPKSKKKYCHGTVEPFVARFNSRSCSLPCNSSNNCEKIDNRNVEVKDKKHSSGFVFTYEFISCENETNSRSSTATTKLTIHPTTPAATIIPITTNEKETSSRTTRSTIAATTTPATIKSTEATTNPITSHATSKITVVSTTANKKDTPPTSYPAEASKTLIAVFVPILLITLAALVLLSVFIYRRRGTLILNDDDDSNGNQSEPQTGEANNAVGRNSFENPVMDARMQGNQVNDDSVYYSSVAESETQSGSHQPNQVAFNVSHKYEEVKDVATDNTHAQPSGSGETSQVYNILYKIED